DSSFHLDVEQWGFVFLPDPVQLAFERAVVLPFIHHLPFDEFVVPDLLLKCFEGHEIVVFAIRLVVAGRAGGGGDGESKMGRVFLQEVAGDGCLTRTRGCGDDNDLLPGVHILLISAPRRRSRSSMYWYPLSICSIFWMVLLPSALRAAMSKATPARISGLLMLMPRRRCS